MARENNELSTFSNIHRVSMTFNDLITSKALKKRFNDKIISSKTTGSDGISSKLFEESLDYEIATIQRKVTNYSYRFSPFKEKLILKDKDSNPRAVYIPTIRDRLVLDALRIYLNELFRKDLRPYQKTVQENISDIKTALKSEQYDAFLKLDVKNFFPSLNHEILLAKLARRVEDKTVLSLLRKILNRSESGVAQGLSISSQLAAIYLNELDMELTQRKDIKYFRFVDDILVICSQSNAKAIEAHIQTKMSGLKLNLHALSVGGKSEIGHLGKDELQYLGFVFKPNTISVREASIEKLRKRIEEVFITCLNDETLSYKEQIREIHHKLNLKITGCIYDGQTYGWMFFFNQINDLTLLHHLDWYVKKTFKRFGTEYDSKQVKSFVKAYFKMKSLKVENLDETSYIPSFESVEKSVSKLKSKKTVHKAEKIKTQISDLQAQLIELENDVLIYPFV
jgi:retron-type reverse transcriptase/ribosomal protein S20